MMNVKSPISILAGCFLFLSVGASSAQSFEFDTGIQFRTGFPQGEFSRNVKNTGLGLGGFFGLQVPDSPVMFGADLGFMIYGLETRKEPFSSTIPDVTVDVETSNNIATGHLFLRLQSPERSIRPYFDALFGFNYLFTRTSIKDEWDESRDIASSTNFDDITLSYGFGGGLQIRVFNDPFKENKLSSVFIDLGVRYMTGGEGEYLKKGSIEIVNQDVMMDVIKSKTDLLSFQMGVALAF